ncbi:MAG TPA: PAS domain-containing protein, partial [Desulfopila sp.]|nr:PAS domain-containing protein [Desulfopila sp.]
MSNKFHNKSDALRQKAEDLLTKLPAEHSETATTDILNLIHELHVHQIELELQNEELQSATESLEKSKSDYMRLYHQAPVGYVVLDQSGITRKVNRTFAAMLDRDAATMSGTPFADFLVTEDRAIFRARLKAFYKNPFKKQIDVRLAQQDEPLYVSLRAIVNAEDLTEAGGPFTELLVTVTDISERHEYQAALEKNRQNLEEILSSISDGFLALDENLHILYFNTAAEQLLKADRKEIIGRELFEAFPMAKGSSFEKKYHEALETGEVTYFETFFNEPPFNDWFEVTVYPYQDGLSIFFRVITERKIAEKTLKESEERFRSSIENSPYGVIVSTEAGDFRQVNPAICDITGFTAEQLLQKNMRDIFFLSTPHQKSKEEDFPLKPLTRHEIHYVDNDASIGWSSISTVKTGKDRYISFVEEITERKRVEKDLSESQRALALYNRVATIFLTSSEDTIFHDVLENLLETFNCSYGYFGYINQEGDLVCPTMTREIREKCHIKDKDIHFPPSSWGGLWGRSLT